LSFKCTETLTIACHSLNESQHTETVDCLRFLLFNPASKKARSKSKSYGKMSVPVGLAGSLGPECKCVNTVKCSQMKIKG
jgi:hypothetical protein